MDIRFCERCDARLKPEDIQSGRCRQARECVWCPDCSRAIERALADPVRAQLVAEPPAQKAPPGVQPVSGKKTPPPRKQKSRKRT